MINVAVWQYSANVYEAEIGMIIVGSRFVDHSTKLIQVWQGEGARRQRAILRGGISSVPVIQQLVFIGSSSGCPSNSASTELISKIDFHLPADKSVSSARERFNEVQRERRVTVSYLKIHKMLVNFTHLKAFLIEVT